MRQLRIKNWPVNTEMHFNKKGELKIRHYFNRRENPIESLRGKRDSRGRTRFDIESNWHFGEAQIGYDDLLQLLVWIKRWLAEDVTGNFIISDQAEIVSSEHGNYATLSLHRWRRADINLSRGQMAHLCNWIEYRIDDYRNEKAATND